MNVQPLSYAYDTQVYRLTNLSPFSLVLPPHSPGPTAFYNPTALPNAATRKTSPHTLKARLVDCIAIMRQDADKQMKFL